jgi:hypothetical protein
VKPEERKAFDANLAEIFAAIDKPLGDATREAFWKGLQDMSILEFARIRDLLLQDFRERDEPPRKFTLGDIWTTRKRLRAAAPPKDDTPKWDGDVWDQVANQQLLRHITTRIPADPLRYGHRSELRFATNINALVAMKNRWAAIMREAAGPDGVPASEQRQCWDECMRQAEEIIAAERANAA